MRGLWLACPDVRLAYGRSFCEKGWPSKIVEMLRIPSLVISSDFCRDQCTSNVRDPHRSTGWASEWIQ